MKLFGKTLFTICFVMLMTTYSVAQSTGGFSIEGCYTDYYLDSKAEPDSMKGRFPNIAGARGIKIEKVNGLYVATYVESDAGPRLINPLTIRKFRVNEMKRTISFELPLVDQRRRGRRPPTQHALFVSGVVTKDGMILDSWLDYSSRLNRPKPLLRRLRYGC